MAETGQALVHIPQTWHLSMSILTFPSSGSRSIALKGHKEKQTKQRLHRSWSILTVATQLSFVPAPPSRAIQSNGSMKTFLALVWKTIPHLNTGHSSTGHLQEPPMATFFKVICWIMAMIFNSYGRMFVFGTAWVRLIEISARLQSLRIGRIGTLGMKKQKRWLTAII